MPLDALFDDESLLAVNKPSGQVVHRFRGRAEETLVDLVREHLGVKTVYPVHRIDRGTSGVVLFAKTAELAALLNERFAAGVVDKTYFALVRGESPADGDIDYPIPRRKDGPRVPARTTFRTLAARALEPRTLSLVEARPLSGRLHQVRRHLKHISHPVIGDSNYGDNKLNRAIAELHGLRRMALHAAHLHLAHPATEEWMELSAPLPSDLADPLTTMGFALPP